MSSAAPPTTAVMPSHSSGNVSPPVNGSVDVPATVAAVGVVVVGSVDPSVATDVVVVPKIVVDVLPSTSSDVVVVGSVVVDVVDVGASVVEEPSSAIEVVVVDVGAS